MGLPHSASIHGQGVQRRCSVPSCCYSHPLGQSPLLPFPLALSVTHCAAQHSHRWLLENIVEKDVRFELEGFCYWAQHRLWAWSLSSVLRSIRSILYQPPRYCGQASRSSSRLGATLLPGLRATTEVPLPFKLGILPNDPGVTCLTMSMAQWTAVLQPVVEEVLKPKLHLVESSASCVSILGSLSVLGFLRSCLTCSTTICLDEDYLVPRHREVRRSSTASVRRLPGPSSFAFTPTPLRKCL